MELLTRHHLAAGLRQRPWLGWLLADGATNLRRHVEGLGELQERIATAEAQGQRLRAQRAEQAARKWAIYLRTAPERQDGEAERECYARYQRWWAARGEPEQPIEVWRATHAAEERQRDLALIEKLEAQGDPFSIQRAKSLRAALDAS